MTNTNRVTISEKRDYVGVRYHVRSGRGLFGIHIVVRHVATALGIKGLLKRADLDRADQSAMIDALLMEEVAAPVLVPVSRLHLVWSRD